MYGSIGQGGSLHFGVNKTIVSASDLEGIDFAVFWGGEDIATYYYNEPARYTDRAVPSARDKFEAACVEECVKKGIPMLGICRGAQLINCLAGGGLFQDVSGHGYGTHMVLTKTEEFKSNTCHHQMLRLPKVGELIGWSDVGSQRKSADGPITSDEPEVEIALFNDMKALAVQYHPEWLPSKSRAVQIIHQLMKERLGVTYDY